MKTAKGQITLVKISDAITYELLPSVTQIIVSADGIISTPTIMCTAYKVEGAVRTELSALEGTIKYKSSSSQAYLNYDSTNGVTVNARWSFITFFLFLAGETDPIIRVDVPITRNGQVDTNFRVWVGSLPNPNTPSFLRPWIGEENEPQTDEMHVNDYYIAPNMQYYCFIQNQINEEYVWELVTDRTLQEWLSRANESTTGFIVDYSQSQGLSDINTIVSTYFGSRNYIIGDLWSGAKYTTTVNGQLQLLYDDEPLLCIRSKFGSFSINDWKPISNTSLNNKLRDVGIDLDEHRVIITSDETWFVNTVGELPKAIFNFDEEDGWSISTDLVKIKGDVEIDGSLIVGALEHQNLVTGDYEIIPELANLLAANNIPQVIHNQDGTISSTINGDTYTWETTDTLNSTDFVKFNVSNGTSDHSFTLNKDGLLQADNAVIYGELHATNGEFFRELQSAGGAFKVDPLGNVTATSFNGLGIISSGTTTITSENFYKYFKQSDLDVLNGSDEDDVYGVPYNKRWIFDLKLILQNIYIESLPSEITYSNPYGVLNGVALVFPHWLYSSCCRRGGLTMPEMFQLNGKVFNIEISNSLAVSVFILNTLDPHTMIVLSSQNGLVDTFCSLLYVADTDGIYPKLITSIDSSVVWQDSEPVASQTNTHNTSGNGETLNQHHYYEISITPVSRLNNTFCFRWMCSSNVNIENLGTITFNGGEYDQNGRPTGYRDVVYGRVEYGQIVGNTVVDGTDGEYQQGYFYILATYVVVLNFKFDNVIKTIENNNNTYKIILSDN